MIAGSILMEDTSISFVYNAEDLTVRYTVKDSFRKEEETLTVSARNFFSALAIAVHNDGMPDWKTDYQDAEKAIGKIRWIP